MQLIAHAPFGGRINRALGLLCASASAPRSISSSRPPRATTRSCSRSALQHSFPLDDREGLPRVSETVRRVADPGAARRADVRGALALELNRALLVLRFKKRRIATLPPVQRMESDDLMVAIFPALSAVPGQRHRPRARSRPPDRAARRSRLLERGRWTGRGLFELLGRIERGDVRLHFRDTSGAVAAARTRS